MFDWDISIAVDDIGKEDNVYKVINGRVYCHDDVKKGWALVSVYLLVDWDWD
jgi:hypothetical protein